MAARNIFFSLVFCLFTTGPCAIYFTQNIIGASLPGWLTSESAEYLVGALNVHSSGKDGAVEGFIEGAFQDALETKLQSSIPLKEAALTINASTQRYAIAASNLFFRWPAYPTFFGSGYCLLSDKEALVRMPVSNDNACAVSAKVFAAGLSTVARANNNINFEVCFADLSSYSAANPARSLVSSPSLTTKDIVRAVCDEVDSQNIRVRDASFDNPTSYFQYYYTTDHHWSGYGALEIYSQLARDLGFSSNVETGECNSELTGLIMNGSLSRGSLLLLNEKVKEPSYDVSGLSVLEGSTPPLLHANGRVLLDSDPDLTEYDFYHTWYGPSSFAIIDNDTGSGTALIVGDSYTSAIQWLIAKNYRTTYVFLDCHGSYRGEESLEYRIRDTNCDAVFFVMGPTGLSNLLDCYPNYFNIN